MTARARKSRPDAERLRQIEAVYHDARERDRSERNLFLVQTCQDDQDLLHEVTSLLDLDESEGPLERPVLDLAAQFLDEPTERNLAPGVRVGPYEIVERIGVGGMGEVVKAHDTRLGRMVALKFVHSQFSGHSLQEARAIAALNHPNICTLHDVGPDYLVLELLEGETLADRLKRGPLPAVEAIAYGAQIADALWSAHSKGITHGDLKPRNLMLTRGGIKVLDFGLARFATTHEAGPTQLAPEVALGTPAYMSPEQLEEKPTGPRTDIFALGLVLFEMSTGRRPFTGSSPAELKEAILRNNPPLDRLLPPQFAHVIERCLAKDPDDRWQTARDVKLELDYVTRLTTKLKPLTRGRRRWLAWAAAAALTVLAISAGYYVQRARPELAITPLTSYPGSEVNPSFSPDGNQFAFSWDGDHEENRDIYVKQVGPGNPLRLTTDPAEDWMPRWSPDGKWIAFLRREPKKVLGLYVVPALGGLERRLGSAANLGELRSGVDWSPDGRWLASSTFLAGGQGVGLALFSLETGETRQLTRPVAPQYDSAVRFSPDGASLAFVRDGEGLMLLSLSPEYTPVDQGRRLAAEMPVPIRSISWTADGHDLIVAAGLGQSSRLWRVSSTGFPAAQRLPYGESAEGVDVARRNDRMVFTRLDGETNIWSLNLDKAGRATGPAVIAFDSTRSETSPDISPDGAKVAFGSGRSGNDEIWVCLSNGSNCAQLTSLDGSHAGSPVWSPNGQWIAFDVSSPNNWEVNVVPAAGGKPRRLAVGLMPHWSHDGRWIYYSSTFGGPTCRISPSGGSPTVVGDGTFPQESPDGAWLYSATKAKDGGDYRLTRRWQKDGPSKEEILPVTPGRNFAVTRSGLWFLSQVTRQESRLSFYDFSTRTTRVVYQTARRVYAGLSISPDGRRVLFTQVDRDPNVDLMLAEHFR
ncbi:protein kinase [uncultured Paludibaculum sp.]|uniref:protein kinase domain-containing protein n=1 Tax=uncultured Paludibaculum sp. TaxID=1765020 RepID=UPI002AAAA1D0|nr:protein kinase [uncultured Paludibaculum sp.]